MSSGSASAGSSRVSEQVIGRLGSLTAAMRAQGARVGIGELLSAHRALAAIDCSSREEARLALRAALCSGREDLERFERAFLAVFDGPHAHAGNDPLKELGTIERAALPRIGIPDSAPAPEAGESMPVPVAWSAAELLREKDFAAYTEAEAVLARRGHAPDLRRTVRASLRTAGEPVERHWRARTVRPRQLVLVCDVSGSMAPYSRMLLQYLHACVAARRRVEAFAFGTRLTRITHELSGRDHDQAMERAAAAVLDFSGGTRIGDALAELNRVHGRRLGRGAVVVILSDGWDRGDQQRLAAEMARLRRSAHRLVWLNPLAAHADYEPLTRGMRAAIPYTDRLLPGNSLASLEELAVILEDV
jgi:uncharacterized protein with von Willebrand factor type A (vWA) domain